MPVNGLEHFDQSPRWSSTVVVFAEDLILVAGNQSSSLPSGSTKEPTIKSRLFNPWSFKLILFGESCESRPRALSSIFYWRLHSGNLLWVPTSSPCRMASETPSARRARCPLGHPSRMSPQLIFTRSRKRNKSRSSSPTRLSSRCPHTELVTTRNTSSTSSPSCIWSSKREQLLRSRKPLQP